MTSVAREVADAVLLEGYALYPYRASSPKNQAGSRWQFGVLAPEGIGEPSDNRTECLIEAGDATELEIVVRFLQVCHRDGEVPWDEGVACEVPLRLRLDEALSEVRHPFTIDGGVDVQADTRRQRWPLHGTISVLASPLPGPYGLVRLTVRVRNHSPAEPSHDRALALRHSLVATHVLLGVSGGAFVSLLETPQWAAEAAARCVNERTWPVLVGSARRDVVLSSPIILYDYPEIAPESAGDMYDATEMDELLVLRTLTLTDEEKAQARDTDPRCAQIIDRVDAMPPELLDRLHGAIRYLRRVGEPGSLGAPDPIAADADVGGPLPWWDPGADRSVSPETDRIAVPGGEVTRGSRVRLHPKEQGTDAQDMFLRDRIATVQAVVSDVDGSTHLAVSLDGDAAAELHQWYGRFLYFDPSEVELVSAG